MLILMDCRPLLAESGSERTHIILSIVNRLSRDPELRWLFVVDQSYRPGILPLPEGAAVLKHRSFPGRMGWRLWCDGLLPRLAGKHAADRIVLTGGISAGARAGSLPQYIWMPERVDPAEGAGLSSFYARRLRDSLSRASLIFCFSPADQAWLTRQAGDADKDKIMVVSAWPSEAVAPLSPEERETVKRAYAVGKEYFLADVTTADEAEITQLLKSFSLFKKRQLSNLQLILAGRTAAPDSGFSQRLETYKYRQDIHWCQMGEAGLRVMGGAYALLFPFERKTIGIPVLDAWKAEVPVIIGKDSRLQELAGDSVLVVDGDGPASLASHMMTVYKDEQLRRNLIEKGRSSLAKLYERGSPAEIWAGSIRAGRQPISGNIQ